MSRRSYGLLFSLALLGHSAGCDSGESSKSPPAEQKSESSSAKKKATSASAQPSAEEQTALDRKAWESGHAYFEKLAAVHEALPKKKLRGPKKCDDVRVEALTGTSSYTKKTPLIVDEEFLLYLATGERPKDDLEDWAWIRSPTWWSALAELRAEGETFDPNTPREGLQKAVGYLQKPLLAVVRFRKRVVPSEKDGEVVAGGFVADVFVMDLEKAELLCATPYDVNQGGKYVHFSPDAQTGNKTALDAAKVQVIRLAETELRARFEDISAVLSAPASFSTIAPILIPKASEATTE